MTVLRIRRALSTCAVVAIAATASAQAQRAADKPRRIAVFGSSVANGTGDELANEGYTGRLRDLLAPRGWEVLNQSRGGDNTLRMAPRFAPLGAPEPNVRYLLPVNPSYVVLGLSLGSEGIREGATRAAKDAIFDQFARGMRGFVDRSRQHGIIPIITLCDTRNDFTEVEYEYVRRMNVLLNSWDVPTVNVLGAVDDGTGRWARGFWSDGLHPNAAGHVEITRTFVPTLFEALERGKPAPGRLASDNFLRITAGDLRISYSPPDPVHPFALGITIRAQQNGIVATINGDRLDVSISSGKLERAGRTIEFESASLTPAGAFTAAVVVDGGRWGYRSGNGQVIRSEVRADDEWHQILVSHYTARGVTLLFVDGTLAGSLNERLSPTRVALGGTTPVDARDFLFYRSALNADEVAALHRGALLQASLELYSPLDNVPLSPGAPVENRAQSMTTATVQIGGR
jgi:lysophospholipase L1-like esterase